MGHKYLEDHPDKINRLIENIGLGLPNEHACRLSGVSKTWFYDATAKAKLYNPDDPETAEYKKYSDFSDRVNEANSKSLKFHLHKISTDPDWRASWALLQARFPEEYGPKSSVKIEGDVRHSTTAPMTFEQLYQLKYGTKPEPENWDE